MKISEIPVITAVILLWVICFPLIAIGNASSRSDRVRVGSYFSASHIANLEDTAPSNWKVKSIPWTIVA